MNDLQFQKAEFQAKSENQAPKCTGCQSPITGEYFQFSGGTICPTCAAKVRAFQQRPASAALWRGLLYGLGSATACSIVYAIITKTTHMEFAIAAIVVGYLVGKAVRIGSRGLGGRRCQVMAVLLTYFAITMSYVPLIAEGAAKAAQRRKAGASKNGLPASLETGAAEAGTAEAGAAGSRARADRPAPDPLAKFPWAVKLILGTGILWAIALVAPFAMLAHGFSGLIGLVIIFFGLSQAWRMTARDGRPLMGPYQLEESSSVV